MGMQSPAEAWKTVQQTGFTKARMDWKRSFVLAFYGGVFIGFAGLASGIVAFDMPQSGVSRLLQALICPVGLLLTYSTGAELFTGNTMSLLAALLLHKNKKVAWGLLRNWGIVLVGNIAGAVFCAYVFGYLTDALSVETVKEGFRTAAEHRCEYLPSMAFFRGVPTSWLISLAVLGAAAAKDVTGRTVAIAIPVVVFVLCQFEHSIANFHNIPLAMMLGAHVDVAECIYNNFIPVLLGNIVGGTLFGSTVLWYVFTLSPPLHRVRTADLLPRRMSRNITKSPVTADSCNALCETSSAHDEAQSDYSAPSFHAGHSEIPQSFPCHSRITQTRSSSGCNDTDCSHDSPGEGIDDVSAVIDMTSLHECAKAEAAADDILVQVLHSMDGSTVSIQSTVAVIQDYQSDMESRTTACQENP
jgi:formate/nitrite transporter